MARTVSLKAQRRSAVGRHRVRRLRAEGKIPAVLYGRKGHVALEINATELVAAFHGRGTEKVLIDLQVEDGGSSQQKLAFLQAIQEHPLTDRILHVDLHELSADEKIHTEVEVHPLGDPVGVRTGGGLLQAPIRHLRISCLPHDLPESIPVSVEALDVGQSIHVGDVPPPAGVEFLNPKDQVLFTVTAPQVEEAAAAEEAKEPELVRERKEAEEAKEEAKE
ncbi:General stress protein CTC [Methylacidimicrobium cyclopophantes]|uniref:Large ribosomal subunit protein bL25 n=1 Tax=Methylacidimicrobium cyclopophantes TaxID=1041766 RepID=A0A5E6M8A0_9BACT|nr:50S ribosomal protein L25 [Methylacidimicrobium cyclopophantes]VVM04566.1 General stress protein CTC [Methylacidimicrobium cyclopophantes]